ncbi:hypothetical protein [Rhodococcus koreensis]
MILKVGQTLASTVDATVVIVVRAPQDETALTCGGVDMIDGKTGTGDGDGIDAAQRGGTQLGKRYVDETAALEVLCTKAGTGTLALDGRALQVKTAKPLPSSD